MIVRTIDGTGDWTFGKGKNDYKKDINAVSQNIRTRVFSFIGDCFFAKSSGINWFNLLGSKNSIGLELAINTVIINTPGITGVSQVSVSIDSKRNITVSYVVNTIYSSNPISGFIGYNVA